MLTKGEESFINKISHEKTVKILPFNKRVTRIADEIINLIKNVYPNLKVIHMGASALEISGQNDIDIYAFSSPSNFDMYLPGLTKLFGKPFGIHETFIEWNFCRNNYDVELYLTMQDSRTMIKQLAVFEILKNNMKLLKKYEKLKSEMNGKSLREYQRMKYEFYNKILKEINY